MKSLMLGTQLVVSLVALSAASAAQLTERSSQRRTLHFVGSGPLTLDLGVVEGNLTVDAYDGHDVEMAIDKTITAVSEAEMRNANADVVLDVGDNASTIHAIARYPNQQTCGGVNGYVSHDGYHVRFDISVRVPRGVQIRLCTINEGSVLVTGTSGSFDVRNINGPIKLVNVAGSGRAWTVNGAISASFVSAPENSSTFRSLNGDISVTLPRNSSADLRLRTVNGHAINDFGAASGNPELILESFNGDVHAQRGL